MAKRQSASKSQPKKFHQAITDAYDRYVKAKAERRATGGDTPENTRRLQEAIHKVCLEYVYATADGEDVAFPQDVAAELAFAFGDIAKGHHVKLFTSEHGRGRPGASFSTEEAQRAAVRYVIAAKRGYIDDPHPVKSVKETFNISGATWRRWNKKHPDVSIADVTGARRPREWVQKYRKIHPDVNLSQAFDALRLAKGQKIKGIMEFAAEHYKHLPGAR